MITNTIRCYQCNYVATTNSTSLAKCYHLNVGGLPQQPTTMGVEDLRMQSREA